MAKRNVCKDVMKVYSVTGNGWQCDNDKVLFSWFVRIANFQHMAAPTHHCFLHSKFRITAAGSSELLVKFMDW